MQNRAAVLHGVHDLRIDEVPVWQCCAGRYKLCPEVRFVATAPVHGAFCNYVTRGWTCAGGRSARPASRPTSRRS